MHCDLMSAIHPNELKLRQPLLLVYDLCWEEREEFQILQHAHVNFLSPISASRSEGQMHMSDTELSFFMLLSPSASLVLINS